MASLSVPLPRPFLARHRLSGAAIGSTLVLGVLALLVLYPLALVLINSVRVEAPGQPAGFSLDAWRAALGDNRILSAVWNTLVLTLARQSIGFPVGILLAWLIARTDLPGASWLEFLFWVAFFLPALPVTLGWILLLHPEYGLVNQLVAQLPFVGNGVFNIYSFWGIVWAHLASGTIATKVILLTPAFRNLDCCLEEASRVSGASALGTLVRIVIPIMAPAIAVVLVLSLIHSMQTFEIEMILGTPIRFFVFSSQIYLLLRQDRPLFAEATVLSSMILGLLLPLMLFQRWVIGRRGYAVVTGQFRSGRVALRRWRIPAFLLVLAVGLLTTAVPLSMLVVSSFMKLFGFFHLPSPWTLDQWSTVFADAAFGSGVRNTLVLAGSTALIAVFFFTLVAYVSVRTRYRGRHLVDFIAWLPSALPGIILGMGLLWTFLSNPLFQSFYGSMAALVVATLVAYMTLGVQTIKTNLVQLGVEMEEAACVSGGSWWHCARHIIFPLLTPVLVLVGAITFVAAAKDVSTIALLATTNTRPLSLLQLNYMLEGRYEAGAVVGVIIVAITIVIALAARLLASRAGISAVHREAR